MDFCEVEHVPERMNNMERDGEKRVFARPQKLFS